MTLEEAYLEHILLHLRTQDPDDRPLRTYIDSWYAHSLGAALLERKIPRPQWLNRGDIERRPELYEHCHAVSLEAERRIKAKDAADLAKDHCVPLAILIAELKDETFNDRDDLRAFLRRRYRVAVVTQEEHRALGRGDAARKKKGVQFADGDSPFARYDCLEWGIEYRVLKAQR